MKLPPDLRSTAKIKRWSNRYPKEEREKDKEIAPLIQAAVSKGYLERKELVRLGEWKSSGRIRRLLQANTPGVVKCLTACVFSAVPDDKERMRILRALQGVDYATASALLHFAFPSRYPVIDFRALRTLGCHRAIGERVWNQYMRTCRRLAECYGVSLRTLDRALWTFDLKMHS